MRKTKIIFNGSSSGMRGSRSARADGEASGNGGYMDTLMSWLNTDNTSGTSTDNSLAISIFDNLGSWLNGIGGLIGGIGTAAGAGKGTGTTTITPGTPVVIPNTGTKSNTTAWVIGGVVGLAAIAGMIILLRKGKKK